MTLLWKRKKSDTEEGEKDKEGERSDNDSAETVSKSMPTSSVSASVHDLGQSKSKKKIVMLSSKNGK